VNNWKVIFATAVIFGAGVITGGLLVNYVQHSRPKIAHANKPFPTAAAPATNAPVRPLENGKLRPPEILSKQFLLQLDATLHLNADQREAIQKIIGEGQNGIRKVMQDARLEIREVLAPAQQAQFDELVKRPFRRPIYGTNATVNPSVATNAIPAGTNAP